MILLHPFVGTTEAFRQVFNLVVTRPVSAPFIWLAQVIVDWSPMRSQFLNAAMLLATALGVGILAATLASLARVPRPGVVVGGCIAAATFIVFPSNIGTFGWSTGMLAVVPATPCSVLR